MKRVVSKPLISSRCFDKLDIELYYSLNASFDSIVANHAERRSGRGIEHSSSRK